MDKTPINTIYKERLFFLAKLKSNPIFLIKHLPSLSSILFQRSYAKYLSQYRKKFPNWLKQIKILNTSQYIHFQNSLEKLPVRKSQPKCHASAGMTLQLMTADPEDYLAEHRWGNLITQHLSHPGELLGLPLPVKHWLQHPPNKNDPAWETYSTCERVANLITLLSFCSPEKRCTIATSDVFDFLHHSIVWIFKHLEFYGNKTGNHILNNARALIMGGVLLKNEPAIQTGIQIFRNMLPILVHPQGSLRERSTHYQFIVLLWLLDADWFLSQSDAVAEEDKSFLKNTIMRMQHFAANLCDNHGDLHTFIGDISPDASPELTIQRLRTYYPEFKPFHTSLEVTHHSYDDWQILENLNNKIVLNCPKGVYPKQFSSHAHGDISSFVWLHEQQPILIDCGRARYTKDDVSILQKSALGHNVSLVNHFAPLCESLVISGNWWPTPYAKANIELNLTEKNSILITHDGYKRATPVTEYQRELIILDDGIQVNELFKGKGKVNIITLWQFHPSFVDFNSQQLELKNHEKMVSISFENKSIAPVVNFTTTSWYSNQYGSITPNPLLTVTCLVDLPFQITTIFRIQQCAV